MDPIVDAALVELIVGLHRAGKQVMFRRNSPSDHRIRVVSGPFNLFSKRYQTNEATARAIKEELGLSRQSSATDGDEEQDTNR
ncbi:MAG: hypothetical protein AAF468_03855 [Pseudomonadota bacterium]